MAEININIQGEVARHRIPTSQAFSLGGRQFCKPEAVVCIKKFDQEVEDNKNHANLGLLPSRAPMRFRVKTHDVVSAKVTTVRGQAGVLLNEGIDGAEIFLPYDQNNGQFGKLTKDALEKALRKEDPNIVFSDVKSTVEETNNYNRDEIVRIDNLIARLNDCKQKILSAIAENEAKAKMYLQEIEDSRPTTVDINVNTSVPGGQSSIVVTEEED